MRYGDRTLECENCHHQIKTGNAEITVAGMGGKVTYSCTACSGKMRDMALWRKSVSGILFRNLKSQT